MEKVRIVNTAGVVIYRLFAARCILSAVSATISRVASTPSAMKPSSATVATMLGKNGRRGTDDRGRSDYCAKKF